jgi:hypothetical protein
VEKVDKGHAAALAVAVLHNLAGENLAQVHKGIVDRAVVHAGMQAGDEDVADARAALGGIALRPHDAQLAALERLKVQVVQRPLGCGDVGNWEEVGRRLRGGWEEGRHCYFFSYRARKEGDEKRAMGRDKA